MITPFLDSERLSYAKKKELNADDCGGRARRIKSGRRRRRRAFHPAKLTMAKSGSKVKVKRG